MMLMRPGHATLSTRHNRKAGSKKYQSIDGSFHNDDVLISASKLGIFFGTGNRFGLFYPKTIVFDCLYMINNEENDSSRKILLP